MATTPAATHRTTVTTVRAMRALSQPTKPPSRVVNSTPTSSAGTASGSGSRATRTISSPHAPNPNASPMISPLSSPSRR